MRHLITVISILLSIGVQAASLLIPMDKMQKNHLKAYGVTYYALEKDLEVDWLLNYRGGSFLLDYSGKIETECVSRGVSFEIISTARTHEILKTISSPSVNMNLVQLLTTPRIAVYSPRNKDIPDETDAVLRVLDYAEIPYTIIYDPEILNGELVLFDWLHLHHEDFTGQINRFSWGPSARQERELQIKNAETFGYASVPAMKRDVVRKINDYVYAGGYLFAMCSGAETFDIARSMADLDLNPYASDLPGVLLDYSKTLAFRDFNLLEGPGRRFSDINTGFGFGRQIGYFSVFEFSAKWDIIPALLTQTHQSIIREFIGLTTAFDRSKVKSTVTILAENRAAGNVRYIYGERGMGHWSYYSGHDPERRFHRRHDHGPTDLSLFPNSPGYRLILNNVLFPSAKKKKRKT